MQLNAHQCLSNKFLDLSQLCELLGADIFCVSEHWLADADEFAPDGFVPDGSSFCRKSCRNGGTGIFVKRGINFNIINIKRVCIELDC